MLKFKIFSSHFLAKLRTQNLAYLSLGFIFILLLLQTSAPVFWDIGYSEGLNQIDIIFRTTLSSIFGFFISTALPESKKGRPGQAILQEKEAIASHKDKELTNNIVGEQQEKKIFNNFRVFILAALIVFCLLTMMLVRNFAAFIASGEYVSNTMTLYRDFISGSIGALIGMARGNN